MFDTVNVRSQVDDPGSTLAKVVGTWSVQWLHEDSRGNRLEQYQVRANTAQTRRSIFARACDDVVDQIRDALVPHGGVDHDEFDRDLWTARIRWRGDYLRWQYELFELLGEVLTLRKARELDVALALDFHQIPPDDEMGSDWTRTAAGDLVYQGKYNGSDRAGRELTDQLIAVADRHPRFKEAPVVIRVPGTTHKFGQRLASTFASKSDRRLVKAVRLEEHRPAKDGHTSFQLEGYRLDGDINGKAVIVVDDLFRSGITMRSIAAAARAAGAEAVYGLAGTRAMRKS